LNITKTLDHKNVLRCYQIIDDLDNDKVFLIIDFCDLGQIMEYDTLTEGYYRNKKLMKYIK
jgi:[calcium/calmodulin-dependent protein kinase] kinase